MNDQATLDKAIDGRKLWIAMSNGRYWQARRNGRTQTWKTRPGEFRLPIKFGFRGTGQLYHNTPADAFLISETNPNA